MYLSLFTAFFLIGFASFGGGYASIALIEFEVMEHGWMTQQELTDIVALASMTPGPIATNSAVFIGYHVGGLIGAVIAAFSITLPSLIIVLLISAFFYKVNDSLIAQSAFSTLRPVITALIIYAAFTFAKSNGLFNLSYESLTGVILFGACFFALWKLKWHPAVIILIAGVLGIILY